jgi:hypothetical protein
LYAAQIDTNITFNHIWKTFSNTVSGFASQTFHFRNFGLFLSLLKTNVNNSTNWNNYVGTSSVVAEKQSADESYYGFNITARGATTCTSNTAVFSFAAGAPVISSAATFIQQSNRYFEYYYDGTAATAVVRLYYNGTGTNPYDLDLFIYNEDHTLSDSTTLAGSSLAKYPEAAGTTGYEAVDLSGHPVGTYLINVQAYSNGTSKETTTFYLQNSGGNLCP